MAKVQIKSEKLTPFGGVFHVMELFEPHLSHIINGTLIFLQNKDNQKG